jgi:serine/threonine-protein kinase RsbW
MRRAEEPTVDVKFCLVFPREALSVPVMRRVLGDTLRRLGAADEDGIADLLLAVTEACTNVIRHGRGGPGRR